MRHLVSLRFAGRTWRYSSSPCEVVNAQGRAATFDCGVEELSIDAEANEVSVALDAGEDWLRLISEGHDLAALEGEVASISGDLVWERRRVLVTGRAFDPIYSAAGDVRFTLRLGAATSARLVEERMTTGARIHEDAAAISLDSADYEALYQVVIGQPGRVSTDVASSGWVAGSKGEWIDRRQTVLGADQNYNHYDITLRIAGHHVTCSWVWLNSDTHTSGTKVRVINTYDALGAPIAVCPFYLEKPDGTDDLAYDALSHGYAWGPNADDIYGLGDNSLDASLQASPDTPAVVYVGWYEGGGITEGGSLIRDAGSVIRWLLRRSDIMVDWAAWATVLPLLQRYRLDFVISSKVTPYEFIRRTILPILPRLTIEEGPRGLRPLWWRWDATPADAVAHLDLDEAIDVGPVTVDASDLANEIVLEYAASYRTKKAQASVTVGAETSRDGGHLRIRDAACARSQEVRGRIEERFDTHVIYDDVTAQTVALDLAASCVAPKQTFDAVLSHEAAEGVEVASVVTLTFDVLFWHRRVALVTSRRDEEDAVRLSFRLVG